MSLVEHICPQNYHRGIQVLYEPEPDYKYWIIRLSRFADQKDVYDGEAEEVGQLLYQHEFNISYCPFCGMKLIENQQ